MPKDWPDTQLQYSFGSVAPKLEQEGLTVAEPVATRAPEPREGVRRMKEYHPPVAGRDGLRLDFNENTLACSPRVIEALRKITAAELTRYPERGSVEAKVAASLCVKPEQVLLTNGVDEAIHVLCQAFLDRGDAMLLPVPTYSMYEVYGSAAEAQIDTVLATDRFRFPLDAMLSAIHPRTRLIAIANPNSPTGATIARDAIIAIAERAPQAVVLVDEAYYHFFGDRSGRQAAEPRHSAYLFKGIWACRIAAGRAHCGRRYDAMAAARDLALQREPACACVPAGRS
jgi:histidinol-phosphate/aromatic aminotransferase/cobyric acid decarboxylase-like protein